MSYDYDVFHFSRRHNIELMDTLSIYRLARWLHLKSIPILPDILKRIIHLMCNSIVPYTAEIGEESRLAYGGIGVVIHARAVIGKRVFIGQNVTIGRQLDPETIPTLGDNIFIGPGVRIMGNIKIGNNVIIGANSVVIRDVPSDCIAAGVPARVIRKVHVDIYKLLRNLYTDV